VQHAVERPPLSIPPLPALLTGLCCPLHWLLQRLTTRTLPTAPSTPPPPPLHQPSPPQSNPSLPWPLRQPPQMGVLWQSLLRRPACCRARSRPCWEWGWGYAPRTSFSRPPYFSECFPLPRRNTGRCTIYCASRSAYLSGPWKEAIYVRKIAGPDEVPEQREHHIQRYEPAINGGL
jgi:hypothetical protein